jgi:hypothetical protein
MRAQEFLQELRRGKITAGSPDQPYNPGWESLNGLKMAAVKHGERMAGSLQLFVPRPNTSAMTARDRRLKNLSNRYAWDDEGNLKSRYANWEQGIRESSPVLTGGTAESPPGNNKPNAQIWTSTAERLDNGSWISDWSRWVNDNQPSWASERGYLFQVQPGARILELDDDHDAERIYQAFLDLGRAEEPTDQYRDLGRGFAMRQKFPWDQIYRHFDAVHHRGYGRGEFVYGWDVESTAWLNTRFLKYRGEVRIAG